MMRSSMIQMVVLHIALAVRIALAGEVPGVVIDHSPASTGVYFGSPAIASLPDGTYVAKCDEFGPKARPVSRLYRSEDRGRTWQKLDEVRGMYWASLFVHGGDLYAMGVYKPGGQCVIFRSTDGGQIWTEPKDAQNGLLSNGSPRFHSAPVPVMIHRGRLWRAMEDFGGPGGGRRNFRAFVMSAPVDADLLHAESWTRTNAIPRDLTWLDGRFTEWIEGNAVAAPDGSVVNLIRITQKPQGGKVAMIRVSADGRMATFDPSKDFIDFPGGSKKFTIRHDPVSNLYWTLSNAVLPEHEKDVNGKPGLIRNAVVLMASSDLRQWKIQKTVLYHSDVKKHGFQYLDWLFEGGDIIAVSRTAFDDDQGGAHRQHDANYLTFHRVHDFRTVLKGP